MTRGIMPGAVWRPVGSFGYGQGRHDQNVPLLFVDHIMSGWKSTMDRPGWQESAGISAHFGIGDDGAISQYVNIFDASWANGVVGTTGPDDRLGIDLYNRTNPRLKELEARGTWKAIRTSTGWVWTLVNGAENVWNCATVTIEHENMTGVPWSDAKMHASVAVKRWVNEELTREGYLPIPFDRVGIIGHGDIDAINRASCPGTGRDLDKMLALLGPVAPSRVWAYGNEQNGLELARNQQVVWIGGVPVFAIGDPEGEGLGRIAKNFGKLDGQDMPDVWLWLLRSARLDNGSGLAAIWSDVEGD